jgi:hydroxypyruvate reductase
VKGGWFAELCAPARVFSIVLSDIMGDLLEMIVASPVYSDSFTCTQALAIAEKSYLSLSAEMTGDNQ